MSVHKIKLPIGDRYEVRWREGARQRARRFTLKGDAQLWDLEVKRRRQLGPIAVQHLTTKGTTLSSWIVDRWVPDHLSTVEQKTRERYASSYKVHIEPWLAHLPLQELTVRRIREWQRERLDAGATPNAILKAREVLSSVIRHAIEEDAMPANPLASVRPPKVPHKDDVIPLSPREVEQIRALLPPRGATIVSVLAYTGMRPGELRNLLWGDIRTNTIYLQRGSNPDGTAKRTKTKRGKRSVRLLPAVRADLAAWRELTGGGRGSLVFPDETGHAMSEDDWGNWRTRSWWPARGAVVDFEPVPYHLRHSFASLLLAEGRSVHYVAGQLGHDASLTLDTYGHLIDEYAESDQIDIDAEINDARAHARAWLSNRPSPIPKLGDRQKRILGLLAAAGDTGHSFHGRAARNDHRAVASLINRGLAERINGAGHATTYRLTTTGSDIHERLSTEQNATERFGLSSVTTNRKDT